MNFGQMQVGHGVAYVLNSKLEPVNVSKTWTRITGRNFLIESAPYTAIRPLLEKVQANAGSAKKDQTARVTYSGSVAEFVGEF